METAFKNYKAASLDISVTTLIRCILHPNTVKPVFHFSVREHPLRTSPREGEGVTTMGTEGGGGLS